MSSETALRLESLADALAGRLARAYVDKIRPRSKVLRSRLEQMVAPGGQRGFLATPLVQSKFGYDASDATLEAHAREGLLDTAFVNAVDGASDQAFPRTRHPYVHQVEAWRAIADRRSVIVSSGTGSGKTESFLFPILSDLYSQAQRARDSLVGVQALLLYPLNALIESQRRRLHAWAQAAAGRVRYCLYNGQTPEGPLASTGSSEVADRVELRRSPPPVLVTNATMLEYMLIRPKDAPIRELSKGRLRYIVLDEAHTYSGSQAAEITLLLRRVMEGFGVEPRNIVFIATSATFGSGGEDALRSFLAGLCGRPEAEIRAVVGRSALPPLPTPAVDDWPTLDTLAVASPAHRFALLAASRPVGELRTGIHGGAQTVAEIRSQFSPRWPTAPQSEAEWLRFFDLAAAARPDDVEVEAFLPIRCHFFGRTLPGLWACINPECPGRLAADHSAGDWPFGRLYFDGRRTCAEPDCGSVVYPVTQCDGCGAEYLDACEKRDGMPRIEPAGDEFKRGGGFDEEDEEELGEDGEDDDGAASEPPTTTVVPVRTTPAEARLVRRAIPGQPVRLESHEVAAMSRAVDPVTGALFGGITELWVVEPEKGRVHPRCVLCDYVPRDGRRGFTRPFLSAQFALAVTTPTLLAATAGQGSVSSGDRRKPFGGRRLLTFTDSRQGTAWYAARQQQDAELQALRSLVYRHVWLRQPPPLSESKQRDLRAQLDWRRGRKAGLSASETRENALEIAELERHLAGASTTLVPWGEVKAYLREHDEVRLIHERRLSLHPGYDEIDCERTAHILLLRELVRRPTYGRSLETLGLVRLVHLDKGEAPSAWRNLGGSPQEWPDFLNLAVDFVLRSGGAVTIDREKEARWLGMRHYQRSVIGPGAPIGDRAREVGWPRPSLRSKSRIVRLVLRAFDVALDDQARMGLAAEVFEEAWRAVSRAQLLDHVGDGAWRLNLSRASLGPTREAWLCPATQRMLATTLRGWSPYALDLPPAAGRCTQVTIPGPPPGRTAAENLPLDEQRRAAERWLADDPGIRALQALGGWGERGSRVVVGEPYYVVAEHTAQIASNKLRGFERAFDDGRINVLSCSTTMEMGIDLGGLTIVSMTNAPPSPANFHQRAGRAGRRGEAVAASFTLCRAQPHDLRVFQHPEWILRPTAAPRVRLESRTIVQRHVNALALGRVLHGERLDKLKCNGLFGPPDTPGLVDEVVTAWHGPAAARALTGPLHTLVRGTPLSGEPAESLLKASADALLRARDRYHAELGPVLADLAIAGTSGGADDEQKAAFRALTMQKDRIENEFLLGYLANCQFLPAHGFPTDVILFNPLNIEALKRRPPQRKRRDDNRLEGPSRARHLALSEYAPGARVVIEGEVHESKGVTLNWHLPPRADESSVELQAIRWFLRCATCGHAQHSSALLAACSRCGSAGLRTDRYLEPAGFAVYIGSKPSNDLSERRYLPVDEVVADVGGAPFEPVGEPSVLTYRHAADGELTYLHRGEHRAGYAVCLRCGRADSEPPPDSDVTPPMVDDHARLRGRLRGARNAPRACDGSEAHRTLLRGLALGARRTTDLLEVRIRDPRAPTGRVLRILATSFLVALREAGARVLGVEARELGIIPPGRGATDEATGWLFDDADGGAGLCTQLRAHFAAALHKARELLDCPNADCEDYCHECLLGYDTQRMERRLNRKAAAEWFDDVLMPVLAKQVGDGDLEPSSIRVN